jgi:hypothetical protein
MTTNDANQNGKATVDPFDPAARRLSPRRVGDALTIDNDP